ARQHTRYNIGEPISSKVIVDTLAPYVDSMYCVDIHDEETLEYSSKPFHNIRITESIFNHYKDKDISYVVSPDNGGYERAKNVAKLLGALPIHLDKKRENDSTVKVVMNDIVDIYGRNVLLLDDVISTGGTILQALEVLKRRKVSSTYVCAIHGVFANNADEPISFSCSGLSVTNTIDTKYSDIDVSDEIVKNIREMVK
ncbi:ribose-phosphate pyrophosphokinase, partial [mine drainage metagenome]